MFYAGIFIGLTLMGSCNSRSPQEFPRQYPPYVTFDSDIPFNGVVHPERFLLWWLERKKGMLAIIIKNSGRYLPVARQILKEEGLPQDLAYLMALEAGFKNKNSPAGARGFWQFMPETGRRFGLRIDEQVDERYNIVKATRAAAVYLRTLYDLFGSWELAIAAYNAGEGRVLEAQKVALRWGFDGRYWELGLPDETMLYVPKLLALIQIFHNKEKYSVDYDVLPPRIVDVEADAANSSAVEASRAPIETADPEFVIVILEDGMSLQKIAREHRVPLEVLVDDNDLTNQKPFIGMRLKIRKPK